MNDSETLLYPFAAFVVAMSLALLALRRPRRWRRAAGCLVVLATLAATLTLIEGWLLSLDTSDYMTVTTVSHRWLRRHAGVPDQLGHRDHPRTNTPDVALLGDSFVWGMGINDLADRVDARLAAHLAERGLRADVADWAVCGAGTTQERDDFIQSVALQGAPRVLVHVYVWNDMRDPPGARACYAPPDWLEPILKRSVALDLAWWRSQVLVRRDFAAVKAARYDDPVALAAHEADLDCLRATIEQRGTTYILAGWPYHLATERWDRAYDWLASYAARRRVRYVDLRKTFAGIPPSDLVVGRFDYHPNERGHDLAARALAEELTR